MRPHIVDVFFVLGPFEASEQAKLISIGNFQKELLL